MLTRSIDCPSTDPESDCDGCCQVLKPCWRCVQAVIEIQRRLPNARVLYVSATGATESSNLGYMQRLGLWGVGTACESRTKFVNLLDQRGVGKLSPTDFPPQPGDPAV